MKNKKAYVISTDDPDDGIKMVFAENANRAKLLATLLFDNCNYIEARAVREPLADKYESISINDELIWNNEEHQRILLKNFSWQEL